MDDSKQPATAGKPEHDRDEAGVDLRDTKASEEDEEAEDQSEDATEIDESGNSADFMQSNPTLRAWMPRQGNRFRFDDVRNEGPTVYGDYARIIGNIINIGQDDRARLSAEPVRRIKLKVATLVKPACFGDLTQRLGRSPVVGLAGPVGTGRSTTACAALVARHGQERVREIMLPESSDPLQIRDHVDLLQKGHGYIIRLGANATAGLLRALERTFEQQEASAVLVRDLDVPDRVLHHAEVFQKSSFDPIAVFRRHLVYNLHGRCVDGHEHCDGHCGIRYARRLLKNDLLRRGVTLLARPRECAQQAEVIATRIPQSNEELAALLPSGEVRRRVRARAILEMPTVDSDYQHRQLQHRRALRVTYAVFSGHPIAHVTDAAGLLLEKLDGLFAHPAIGRPALVHSLPRLLGDDLAGDWDGEKELADRLRPDVATRMAQVEPDMVRALLDVSWNEFDNSQSALIGWLDALATHPAENFKHCAAVAAAGFACHDFDQVYSSVISNWAKDRKPALRRAAAAALVAAANLANSGTPDRSPSHRISSRVSVEISSLARSDAAFERDTAAKAWSMGFRTVNHNRLLHDLTHVARNAHGYLGHEVTESVTRLAGDLGHAPILVLLKKWSQSEDSVLEVAAGRAFSRLTTSELPFPGQFPLLSLAGASPQALEDVAAIWRLILLDPDLAENGWRQLGHWLRSFRAYPPTAEAFRALLRNLVLDRSVQPRFAYWLSRAGSLSHFASAA
ncbi:hypothetical protein ACGFH8_18690 [Micromonospora sp. NPDC049175]|uniref:hypothetical protein n=1 Tax=Micromonospora sp. NPDC049175 TaxID=3364266 RepID=UPI0037171E39